MGSIRVTRSWRKLNARRSPGDGERRQWKQDGMPQGPIGLLLEMLHLAGAAMDEQLCVRRHNHALVHTIHGPLQAVKPAVRQVMVEARTAAAAGTRNDMGDLTVIDKGVTQSGVTKRAREERNFLNIFRTGGGWSRENLYYSGAVKSQECNYCGCHKQTVGHLVWECPQFDDARRRADKPLAEHGHLLPGCLRLGIAPPSRCQY